MAVVDQDFVAWPEHFADRRGRDLKLPVVRREPVPADDDDLRALLEKQRRLEAAHSELRPLEVANQRNRLAGPLLCVADELCGLRVVVVRAVREVQPCSVHACVDERPDALRGRGGGTDRGDDLRPARRGLDHLPESSAAVSHGTAGFARQLDAGSVIVWITLRDGRTAFSYPCLAPGRNVQAQPSSRARGPARPTRRPSGLFAGSTVVTFSARFRCISVAVPGTGTTGKGVSVLAS